MAFSVIETGDEHRATVRPLVIITSNNEKSYPMLSFDGIFHFIAFPMKA